MAENGANSVKFKPAPVRGNYKVVQRQAIKKRIREMLVAGEDIETICKALRLSERSFYRYQELVFREDVALLQPDDEASRQELLRQAVLCKWRMERDRKEINDWLTSDPKSRDRVELANLRAEISAAILRVYVNGPAATTKALVEEKGYTPNSAVHYLYAKDPLADKEEG